MRATLHGIQISKRVHYGQKTHRICTAVTAVGQVSGTVRGLMHESEWSQDSRAVCTPTEMAAANHDVTGIISESIKAQPSPSCF